MPLKVFVDSDVIISSLISSTGAAYLLLNQEKLDLAISSISLEELKIVVERLDISKDKLNALIKRRFKIVSLNDSLKKIKLEHKDYVSDINDAHIVAGAREGKVKFLISYNTKHFKAEKLKEDFNIILVTPAKLLQYLRSLA